MNRNSGWSWNLAGLPRVARPSHARPNTDETLASVHRSRPQYHGPLSPRSDHDTTSSSGSGPSMRFQKSWTAGWRHSPYFGLLAPSKMGDEQMQGHSRERAQRADCNTNSKWLIVLILTILVVVSLVVGFTVYAVTRSDGTGDAKVLALEMTYEVDKLYEEDYSNTSSSSFDRLQTELCTGVVASMDIEVVNSCQVLAAKEGSEPGRTVVTFHLEYNMAQLSAAIARRGIDELTSSPSRDTVLIYALMAVLEAEPDNVLHGSDVCRDASCRDKVTIVPMPSSTQDPTELEPSSTQPPPLLFNQTATINITWRFPDMEFIPEYYDVTSDQFKEMESLLCNEFIELLGGALLECSILQSTPGSTVDVFQWVLDTLSQMAADIAADPTAAAAILAEYQIYLTNLLANAVNCDAAGQCEVPDSLLST